MPDTAVPTPETMQPLQRDGSVVRCGTASGARLHQEHGEKSCPACAAAKAEYDQRWRSAPERVRLSRLNARAQQRALKRLKDAHADEYRALYAEEKAKVYADAEVALPSG